MNRSPILVAVPLLALLSGCATVSLREAPIVDRSERRAVEAPPAAAPAARAARDGQYVVQRGDTLYSIALEFGHDFRDLARWNALDDPSKLQVGQILRLQPPAEVGGAAVAAVPVAPVAAVEVRPLDAAPVAEPKPPTQAPDAAPPAQGAAPAATLSPAPAPAAPAAPAPAPPAAPSVEPTPRSAAPAVQSGLTWAWPAAGKLIEVFDEARNKGIDIAGQEGDPVLAAADGQVVYRGNALRGYGNLVIIKHSDDFISAYAHNRQILVEQGQNVKRGQRIAEIGRTDADRPKLHFEIRRQGRPIDPVRLLPPR
jgi:lipoprotein NlpD